jgi:hypothetical protein
MKRQIKKDGNRSRRRHFQRQLQKNPEDAHWDEFEFKHNSSTSLNGLDSTCYQFGTCNNDLESLQ